MRLIRSCVVLMLLGLLWSAVPARAESLPFKIALHRAIYKMTLAKVRNGSPIGGVSGKMYFDWGDACDGWAIQQKLALHFSYAQGDTSDLSSSIVTWESKDGRVYHFNVRRITDGKETENYRGKAVLDTKGGMASYSFPKDRKDIKIPAKAVFPSAHTIEILKHALAGKKMFTKRVFDGSDDAAQSDISAFIGMKAEHLKEKNKDLEGNPLLLDSAWPVRLAFYKPDTETGTPDYEMNLLLQENGIARSMRLDYGDFSVAGELLSLEAAPPTDCLNVKE